MKQKYVHREIEPLLIKMVGQFPAVALSGPRQCGKSTLLKELFGKDYQYLSFDDPVVRERAIGDPRLFLDQAGEKVIVDEIQYVPQLLSYVKMAIDQNRGKRGRFIFTGSQQFMMIQNLGDSLAGRIGLLDLLPFGINEKRQAPGFRGKLSKPIDMFVDACLRGSYPELVVEKKLDFQHWYGAYLQTYLERDIRSLYNIGSLRDFQLFMQLAASRAGQILNFSSFSSDLGVSVNTIRRWVSILEAGRMVYLLPPYYRNFGKRVTKSPKMYFLDCGLVCYLTGIRDKEHLLKGPLAGNLFENFVIQETVKSFLFRGLRPPLFYFRSHNGLEVDLLIADAAQALFPFEIKLTQTPRPGMGEAIIRFKKLMPKLNISQGSILSLSEVSALLSRDVFARSFDDYLTWLRKGR